MKKLLYFIFIVQLLFATCTTKPPDEPPEPLDPELEAFVDEWGLRPYLYVCKSVKDAVKYPEPWNNDIEQTFVIPDETIRSMSTCGLLETMLNYSFLFPLLKTWGPSEAYILSFNVTMFNNDLREYKAAVEFFNRDNFFPVLVSKYLPVINANDFVIFNETRDDYVFVNHIEMLLSSDMCMSLTNEREKNQLMAMALERIKYTENNYSAYATPCHIMIAIMKSSRYEPFMQDIEPRLIESTYGYAMREPDGNYLDGHHYRDIIMEYANQFLNEQKL